MDEYNLPGGIQVYNDSTHDSVHGVGHDVYVNGSPIFVNLDGQQVATLTPIGGVVDTVFGII